MGVNFGKNDITGLDEVLKKLNKLGDLGDEMENRALTSAGILVLRKAQRNLFVLLGRSTESLLFRSLGVSKPYVDKRDRKTIRVGDIENRTAELPTGNAKSAARRRSRKQSADKLSHAFYYEYGTTRQKARPFLRPAVFDNIGEIKALMEAKIHLLLQEKGLAD